MALTLLLLAVIQDPFLPAAPSFERRGDNPYEHVGWRGVNAGDVNGDGRDDLLVLTPDTASAQNLFGTGRVEIFYGRAHGYSANADWTVRGDLSGNPIVWDAAGIGDVNADGYDDVAVSTRNGGGSPSPGAVNVFYGGPAGPNGGVHTIVSEADWRAVGVRRSGERFGFSVLGPGDVTGDRVDDLLVGCTFFTDGQGREGAVFLFKGDAAGLPGGPVARFRDAFWSATSNRTGAEFGTRLHAIGDVNGDCRADFAVTGQAGPQDATENGRHWVFTDVTAGGRGQDANGAAWATLSGNGVQMSRDLAAADFNRDGYSDLVLGFPNVRVGGRREPLQLWFGGPGGFTLSSWQVELGSWFDGAGTSLAAGDLDVDGIPDLAVVSALRPGRVRVLRGIDNPSRPIASHVAWEKELASDIGAAEARVEIIGDPEGDGTHGLAVSEPHSTVATMREAGRVRVFTRVGDPPDPCPFARPVWTMEEQTWLGLRHRVILADVDGDTHADAVICTATAPHVRVYRGSTSGLDASPWVAITISDPDAERGFEAVAAADVDGIAGDEVLLLRRGREYSAAGGIGSYLAPKAYLLKGDANRAFISWTAQQATADPIRFALSGTLADVDGDGLADVVLGAPGHERDPWPFHQDPYDLPGSIYVYLGSRTGPNGGTPGDETNAAWSATDLDPSGSFGMRIFGAGDLDDDSVGELLVTAPLTRDASGDHVGAVYLWNGVSDLRSRPPGTPANADWSAFGSWPQGVLHVGDAGLDVTGNGTPDLVAVVRPRFGPPEVQIWNGTSTGFAFVPPAIFRGGPLSPPRLAPDIDGDGVAELCINRPYETVRTPLDGEVGVLFGGPGLFPPGLTAPPWNWRAAGEKARVSLGFSSRAPVRGDVNGDGRTDLLLVSKWYLDREPGDCPDPSDLRSRVALYLGTAAPLLELRPSTAARDETIAVGHLGGQRSAATVLVPVSFRGVVLPIGPITLASGMTDDARCWHTDWTVPSFAPTGVYELRTVQLGPSGLILSQPAQLVVN